MQDDADDDADNDDDGNDDEHKEGGVDMDMTTNGPVKTVFAPDLYSSIFLPLPCSSWPPGYDDHDQMVNVMVVISMLVKVTKG